MSDGDVISRQSFDEAVARLGIEGSKDHVDELFRQVKGVLIGTQSLLGIDVSGVEPDIAFNPSGAKRN